MQLNPAHWTLFTCRKQTINQLVYVFHKVFHTHNPKFMFSEIIYSLAVLTQSIRAMMT